MFIKSNILSKIEGMIKCTVIPVNSISISEDIRIQMGEFIALNIWNKISMIRIKSHSW
jgi:hypothetical protein